jgi:histidinol-phosphatase (PHP family)
MKVKLWDYHTHCSLDKHAKGNLQDYVEVAVKKGLGEIGLSDHFPMETLPESANVWQYAMSQNEFPQYLQECKRLQHAFEDKITIKIASEVDYFPPSFPQYQKLLKPYWDDLDYIIGSIHVIQWEGIPAWGVDDEKFLSQFRTYGADKVYLEYYNAILRMVKTKFYNIIGHIDVPKKFGIMPQTPETVWQKLLSIFDAVQQTDMAIEINMAGFLKPVKEQYPSERIIKELIARKIPITLGSDAHEPDNVGYNFEEMAAKLRKWGLTTLYKFTKHQKVPVKNF